MTSKASRTKGAGVNSAPPSAVAPSKASPSRLQEDVLARLTELSKEELVEYIRRQHEAGVRITFSGKQNARQIARKVQPRVSRRIAKYSVGSEEEQSRNALVEGENLQAMATIYRERGQVDLILTDPPYNTGNDFRYNDKWDEDPNDPDLGELVSAHDGARHTKWMKFMWPRLQMMRDMLKPNGVLAICIDHRELFRLGQMLDELFGESNRIAIINWQKNYAPRNDNRHVSTATEYVLVYAKNEELATTRLLPRSETMNARYGSPDGDVRIWASDNPYGPSAETHQGMVYGIQSPFTGEMFYPPEGRCWGSEKKNIKAWLEGWGSPYRESNLQDGLATKSLVLDCKIREARAKAETLLKTGPWPRLYFTNKGAGGPRTKRYLDEVKKGSVPITYWADEDYDDPTLLDSTSWDHEQSGHNQMGLRELDAIVGKGHGFETVKPLKLFSKIIHIWCPPSGLVVDPFAGSGTTGNAVLHLNYVAGSERRFVLIEQGRPEKGDAYARSLTADRLRRVVTGEWAGGPKPPLGGGFRFVALQNKVDARALLNMERDEMADAVIASHFDNVKRGPNLVNLVHEGFAYLVARNSDQEGFFLVWDGSKTPPVFDESVYDAVVAEAEAAGLKPVYHVYARFNLYQSDDVTFYQIPNRILMDFGVSPTTDPFHNDDSVLPVELD